MNTDFSLNEKKEAKFTFATTELRDAFLQFFFPERTLMDEPGLYKIANGNLSVYYNTVFIINRA